MTEFLVLEGNPRRKRRKHIMTRTRKNAGKKIPHSLRKKIRHRPVFYGDKEKIGERSPFKRLNPKGVIMKKRKHSKRRYRHNPPFSMKGITSGIGNNLKEALIGAAGIAGTKLIANKLSPVIKVDAANKTLVELAVAMFALPAIGKAVKMPMLATAGKAAAAVSIYQLALKYLPSSMKTMLAGNEDYYVPGLGLIPEETVDNSTPAPLFVS